MSKILYPIFKLPSENEDDVEYQAIPTWIKWWMINNYKKRNWILSEILTGNPLTLENSVETKFYLPPLPRGNSEQDGEPSPSNEVPITNVTGDVEVLLQNKNILRDDISYTSTYHDSRTYLDLNIILGTASTLYAKWVYAGRVDNTGRVYARFTTTDDYTRFLIKHNGSTTDLAKTYNFNFKNNTTYIISINLTGVNPTVDGGFSYNDVMITTGSADYAPHKEQSLPLTLGEIELCKIGTAQDYFYKENSKWYLYKAIGKTIFDGSSDESWSYYSNTGLTNRRFIIAISEMKQGTNNQYPVLCNRFKQGANSTDDNFIFVTSSNKIVWFGSTDLQSLDTTGFKTWLSSNNVIVYYLLDTPTSIEITDTTLIEQLDDISNAISYEEQTNINGSSDESNPLFEVQYYMINESEGE